MDKLFYINFIYSLTSQVILIISLICQTLKTISNPQQQIQSKIKLIKMLIPDIVRCRPHRRLTSATPKQIHHQEAINEEPVTSKQIFMDNASKKRVISVSRINIFDQAESEQVNLETLRQFKIIENRKYWENIIAHKSQTLRVKTQKNNKNQFRQNISAASNIRLKTKHMKNLNKSNHTERISQLNITQKKIDYRPNNSYYNKYTIQMYLDSIKVKRPNSFIKRPNSFASGERPRVAKRNSISPW